MSHSAYNSLDNKGKHEMADSSSSRMWTVLGTIATIVIAIGAAIPIWNWVWGPTTELQATVEYGTYLVDPWTAADMSADSKKLGAIVNELNGYRIAGGKLSAPLEKYADDALKISKYDSIRLDSNQSYGYIRTVISDKGDLGAKDVALRVPRTVGSLVTFDDGSKKVFGGSPTIYLGDLRPEEKVTVYSWLLSPPAFFVSTDNNISLTYAGGKGNVEVPGKHSMAYKVLTSPPMAILYAAVGLWFLVGVWQLGFQRGRNQNKSKPDSSPQKREAKGPE